MARIGRPKKQGVDYFPHMTVHDSKALDTLEREYGNDGYAFWFKLLELLGKQDGLYYDCSSAANWRYLASNARVSMETAESIMSLLSDFEAVDAQLWKKKRIIWVQNLVDNLSKVFAKRETETPQKPSFCSGNKGKKIVSGEKTIASISEQESMLSDVSVAGGIFSGSDSGVSGAEIPREQQFRQHPVAVSTQSKSKSNSIDDNINTLTPSTRARAEELMREWSKINSALDIELVCFSCYSSYKNYDVFCLVLETILQVIESEQPMILSGVTYEPNYLRRCVIALSDKQLNTIIAGFYETNSRVRKRINNAQHYIFQCIVNGAEG